MVGGGHKTGITTAVGDGLAIGYAQFGIGCGKEVFQHSLMGAPHAVELVDINKCE